MIEPRIAIWIACAALAALLLTTLMRKRQAALVNLLQEYMKSQHEWVRKRAKAAEFARRAAHAKEKQAHLYSEEES